VRRRSNGVGTGAWEDVIRGSHRARSEPSRRTALRARLIVKSPLDADVIREAVALYRTARRVGATVRSSVDCVIAACALRHDLVVLHDDRDFDAIARISPLKATNVRR